MKILSQEVRKWRFCLGMGETGGPNLSKLSSVYGVDESCKCLIPKGKMAKTIDFKIYG